MYIRVALKRCRLQATQRRGVCRGEQRIHRYSVVLVPIPSVLPWF